jgi:hypothetical protein
MNQLCYDKVHLGDHIHEVAKLCGPPYEIHSHGGNADVYEYIEWVYLGTQIVQTRRYFLMVSNDKVVGKHMRITNPPPLYIYGGSYPGWYSPLDS